LAQIDRVTPTKGIDPCLKIVVFHYAKSSRG
jgi:hypothetical protein